MKTGNKQGFTLVEIMIVVAIIGLLAAIGIPSFQKARTNSVKRSMENNVRVFSTGVEQYAMENALNTNGTFVVSDIEPYLKGGSVLTLKVGNNAFTAGDVGLTVGAWDSSITNLAAQAYGAGYTGL